MKSSHKNVHMCLNPCIDACQLRYKHLKKSNAAWFCMPIVLKLLIIVQM